MSDKGSINNITLPVYKRLKEETVARCSCSNIEELTDSQLDELRCGDSVQKITGQEKHNYIVTYKQDKHGISLSYYDCGYLETISYDYIDGHWVFNSKDVCDIGSALENIKSFSGDVKVTTASQPYVATTDFPTDTGLYRLVYDDTIVGMMWFNNMGFGYRAIGNFYNNLFKAENDINTNLVFANNEMPLPTKLYRHRIACSVNGTSANFDVISPKKDAILSWSELRGLYAGLTLRTRILVLYNTISFSSVDGMGFIIQIDATPTFYSLTGSTITSSFISDTVSVME